MAQSNPQSLEFRELDGDRIWPSAGYSRQIERLKQSIGKQIYLVELKPEAINMGIRFSDTAYELVDVIDFPRPDPAQGIAPHLILLDDGRGINLGRIARITIDTPYSPPEENILYQESFLMESLLLRERRLSHTSIAERSKILLGRLLGKPIDKRLTRD
ncbi:hypothetical protein [Sedimenticola selenatireducens]|jgi:hypothetical protein|uniref:Uncharacterized protein n=1 Tax=Sedimenticola selenatireducens TaxID=191960 RepID=A0A557SHN0_9GAMM|nr:hypothetical protein [Sedimenticola selenatireducens]TVO76917.1 hypothetical protein FHP88_05690 [Sedimenticola selenatireducens]TVT64360.1 MAG: hypothetical protein FHK78_08935 [Sedimenticola selenatireducens]